MEPDFLSPKIHWEPVNFDNRVTNTVRRSRTGRGYSLIIHEIVDLNCMLRTVNLGTSESGVDVSQHTKTGAKQQQKPSVGNYKLHQHSVCTCDLIKLVLHRFRQRCHVQSRYLIR